MPRARSETYDLATTTFYHCISRCVRRAFLCGQDPYTGQDFSHRKEWVESRLFALANIFAVELYAYAVMANHLHIVVRVRPDVAIAWTDEEVVARYTSLFKTAARSLEPLTNNERTQRIKLWRERLTDLSWFMRTLNENIARRANKEDGCTGRFWEGRFTSQPLLDEDAVLTCMVYVDLNPVRSGEVESLDDSSRTSIASRLRCATRGEPLKGLTPFSDQCDSSSSIPMNFLDYVQLLEWTGRCSRAFGPAARLRGRPPLVLVQRQLASDAWLNSMQPSGLRATALGSAESLRTFARTKSKRWVHGLRRAITRSAA